MAVLDDADKLAGVGDGVWCLAYQWVKDLGEVTGCFVGWGIPGSHDGAVRTIWLVLRPHRFFLEPTILSKEFYT